MPNFFLWRQPEKRGAAFQKKKEAPDSGSRYLKRVSCYPSEKVTHQKEYPKAGAEFCIFPNKKKSSETWEISEDSKSALLTAPFIESCYFL